MLKQCVKKLFTFCQYIFVQDFEKQSEEIERLRALLTQHNIPFDSKPSKSLPLSSLHSFKFYALCSYIVV